jgi:hypothetical protein
MARPASPSSVALPVVAPTLPTLTEQQAQALSQLAEPGDKPYLLWGCTGSG